MFLDLENAYARVPRKVFKWVVIKKGVLKVYINVTEEMCERSCTSVKSRCEKIANFMVGEGVQQ